MGAQRFARATGVSQSRSQRVPQPSYKQRYPKVFAFLELAGAPGPQPRLRGNADGAPPALPFRSPTDSGACKGNRSRWRSISMWPGAAAWKPSNCGPLPMPRSRAPAPTSSKKRWWICNTLLLSVRATAGPAAAAGARRTGARGAPPTRWTPRCRAACNARWSRPLSLSVPLVVEIGSRPQLDGGEVSTDPELERNLRFCAPVLAVSLRFTNSLTSRTEAFEPLDRRQSQRSTAAASRSMTSATWAMPAATSTGMCCAAT